MESCDRVVVEGRRPPLHGGQTIHEGAFSIYEITLISLLCLRVLPVVVVVVVVPVVPRPSELHKSAKSLQAEQPDVIQPVCYLPA